MTVASPYDAMLRELRQAGIDTSDFGVFTTLRPTSFDHARAVPVLVRWLPRLQDPGEKEAVVRHLTGERSAVPQGASGVLIDEFLQADDDGLKWTIGNALATLASTGDADKLIELLQDRRHGRSRQMLADALKRTKDGRAPEVLIELVDDRDVAGHVILALRLYGPRSSLPYLRRAEPKLVRVAEDVTFSEFSRRQAQRALEKLDSQA